MEKGKPVIPLKLSKPAKPQAANVAPAPPPSSTELPPALLPQPLVAAEDEDVTDDDEKLDPTLEPVILSEYPSDLIGSGTAGRFLRLHKISKRKPELNPKAKPWVKPSPAPVAPATP